MIQSGLKTEHDWTVFMTQFQLLNKGLYNTINNRHKDLSKNDLRIIALTQLNLSSNDMSHVMNISFAGVKKARQRLRDKLSLPEKVTLKSYVHDLSEE